MLNSSSQGGVELDHLYVVHPNDKSFPMAEDITAIGIDELKKGMLLEE